MYFPSYITIKKHFIHSYHSCLFIFFDRQMSEKQTRKQDNNRSKNNKNRPKSRNKEFIIRHATQIASIWSNFTILQLQVPPSIPLSTSIRQTLPTLLNETLKIERKKFSNSYKNVQVKYQLKYYHIKP